MSIPEVQVDNANTGWINNRADENTAKPLKGCENRIKNRIQLIARIKAEKQAGTIQLSKYVVCIQDAHKVCTNYI